MSLIISLFAGVLSTLSPCVLPILPIIVSSALQEHKRNLLALMSGLALSFAVTGTFITYAAVLWDFDITILRNVSAILLISFALILLIPKLNNAFTLLASRLMQRGNNKVAHYEARGAHGQFVLGVLLAMVWTPCVGPIMGSAISLAIQGDSLSYAFSIMLAFGIGASMPLLLIGLLGHRFVAKRKGIMASAQKAKIIMGVFLLLLGILVLTGYDKVMEMLLLEITPAWLTDLSTSL